jgi:hypothetical protein
MASTSQSGASHGQFLLLLDARHADEGTIDTLAYQIHKAYMIQFGHFGAFTVSLLKLDNIVDEGTNMSPVNFTHLVRYFGPVNSVGWLRDEITRVGRDVQAEPAMQTFMISDITGRY